MTRWLCSWLVIVFALGVGFASLAVQPALAQPVLQGRGNPAQQTALFYQWYIPTALHATRLCAGGAGSSVVDDPALKRFVSAELVAALHEAGRGNCVQKLDESSAYFLHADSAGAVRQMPSEVATVVQTASRALVRVRLGEALLCVRLRHEREGWRLFRVEPQGEAERTACAE
ncbi:hypothetical protein [Acetobacter papayae]|uniref:hypothetical protein n=1 Tax=Acetobacter papayae TaxID=1076592 RepID=UPI0004709774|nr:hypothetical protein [Acetobacter papayae]